MIQLVSSLAYANVVKLGYDPTMELFWESDKKIWNHKITMKGKDNVVTKVYKTIDIIADLTYRQTYVVGQRAFTRLMTLKTQIPR